MTTPNEMPPGENSNQSKLGKRELFQQQLMLLHHAHKCMNKYPRTGVNDVQVCKMPHCDTMQRVLQHLYTCQDRDDCKFAHCFSSRKILKHWRNCIAPQCSVCYPLKACLENHENKENIHRIEEITDVYWLETIQQQLILLLHAQNCTKPNIENGESTRDVCKRQMCDVMKALLHHQNTCQDGEQCLLLFCSSSRKIIQHWRSCNSSECKICSFEVAI